MVLKNIKHERFAQFLAMGKAATDAYAEAGFKPDDGNASRLANKVEVVARVQEMTGAAAEKLGVTAERVMAELAKIAFSDIRKVVSWRPEVIEREVGDGAETSGVKVLVSRVTVLDSATIDDDAAASVAEVSLGASGALRVKMHDKPAALEKLGRHLALFKDRVEHDISDPLMELFKAICGTGIRPSDDT